MPLVQTNSFWQNDQGFIPICQILIYHSSEWHSCNCSVAETYPGPLSQLKSELSSVSLMRFAWTCNWRKKRRGALYAVHVSFEQWNCDLMRWKKDDYPWKKESGRGRGLRLAKWTHRGINREHIATPTRLSLPETAATKAFLQCMLSSSRWLVWRRVEVGGEHMVSLEVKKNVS